MYVIPPTPVQLIDPLKTPSRVTDDRESQDFDDLIFALKTGRYAPSDSNQLPIERDHNPDPLDSPRSQYEMRRIAIADTHL